MSRSLPLALVACLLPGLAGCGVTSSPANPTSASAGLHSLTGNVHGGQQPIAGAQIALYAAGTTGFAAASRSMLTAPVFTTAGGNFTIDGFYSCQPGDQVYIVATGGNSGAGTNSAIALMAGLGSCSNLQANSATIFIDINEVTTVGSVAAMYAFMSDIQHFGAGPRDFNSLIGAIATIPAVVDIGTGKALQTSMGNGIVPQATINSLANSIANCVNSPQGSGACASLFAATTVSGSTPADTIQAALNVIQNPTANPSGVFNQTSPTAPFQPTLSSPPASYSIVIQHPSDVLMYHNDAARDGVQSYEPTLTAANVNPAQFGKLNTFPVDSYLFAQPLYVGGLGMPDNQLHNVVYVASSRATVYAFDADGNNPAQGYLWSQSYIPSGERYAQASDYGGCTNPPEAGIVGTPVIDRATQTMYFVVKSVSVNGSTFYHRLHAVNMIDGTERGGSPQTINPTFAGTGDGSSGGTIAFNGQTQNQHAALLLSPNGSGGNTVWIAYASHCDMPPYHGIVLGYDSDLNLVGAFNDTPNGAAGGIWGSFGGLNADAQGNIYLLGGSGTFDANTGGADLGDSAVKLVPPAAAATAKSVTTADYFTPSNQSSMQQSGLGLGGTEGILIEDSASGVAPNLLVTSDMNGYIYLLNANNLGKYNTGSNGVDGTNGDLQDFGGNGMLTYNFAYFNNTLYTGEPLSAYTFVPGTATTAGHFNTTPAFTHSGYQSVAPVVSANGTANPILWFEDQSGALRAVDPASFADLYGSDQAGSRDTAPPFVRFTSPVVANGKVFLSGQGSLAVYGELP